MLSINDSIAENSDMISTEDSNFLSSKDSITEDILSTACVRLRLIFPFQILASDFYF